MKLILILVLALVMGCAKKTQGIDVAKSPNIFTNSLTNYYSSRFLLPVRGACVALGNGHYAENEGDHIDIYDNSVCDHSGDDDGDGVANAVICNDMRFDGDEICLVGRVRYTLEGTYSDTVLLKETFDLLGEL